MAFDRTSFVDLTKGTLGASEEAHRRLLHLEHVQFADVLSGSDSTSGVPVRTTEREGGREWEGERGRDNCLNCE
jgi:hypothetical protein